VGAARPRGRRGGEGGRRWATADRLRLAMPPPTASASPSPATAMPPPTAQIVTSPKPEKREKREDRRRGEKRERTQREDKKGEDPRARRFRFFGRASCPGSGFGCLRQPLPSIFGIGCLKQPTRYFSCRLVKTADIKNESLFLITVEIISRHHKKILGVTINRFSSSASNR
jgi:hypothetical protein